LRTSPSPHAVILVPTPTAEAWTSARRGASQAAHDQGVILVAIDPVAGPSAIHRAYGAAARDVPLARAVAGPGEVRPDDLVVFRVLASAGPDEGKALLSRTLGPLFQLTENRRETLLETLDALWASEGRVVEAADALAITERALRYRIRRLQELTGLDPDNPADRLQLDLARHALRLYPDHLVMPRRPSLTEPAR
jgi:DNA-binding PucR family transcriptional regulator